jgi:hypothetical protein
MTHHDDRVADLESALREIRPVILRIWKGGAYARQDGVLELLERIDAALLWNVNGAADADR